MTDTLNVRDLFGLCAEVTHVQKPVFIEVQNHIVSVTGTRDQQGVFIIETAESQNGVVHEPSRD